MKEVEYKKPVSTIPKGVWESSRLEGKSDKDQKCTQTTDLQGNGYPVAGQTKSKDAQNKSADS